ncbi:MAG: DUF4870 domain-containing protein [Planctomycetota bacterium]|jgi:uncharacterized Tic20 family protein
MVDVVQSPSSKRLTDLEVDSGQRTYALFIHLLFIILPVPVAPQLVMWLLRKDESAFIDDHGREAVNFQISLLLIAAVSGLLVLIGIGLLVLLVLPWFGIICSILGAVAASRGEYFRYPMTIRLIQ